MANRTIGTELKLTGEKEFNQQMKAINSGLKTTKSDMAALSAEFDDNANSMQSLTAKHKLLQSSVDQHKAKVEALSNQYKAAAATYGENSYSAQKYRQQLNQATVALQKETAALEKNASAMKEKYLAGLKTVAAGAKNVFNGLGSAAGDVAKGVGLISAASAAGVAAIGAGGLVALTTMVNMAKEAAEAAKAAQEAGETLTASQEQWLAFSGQLDALDASVASAKSALGGVLLPILGDLSEEGAAFLNSFASDMEAAAGDTEQQGRIMADYIAKGAKLIKEKLPEFIQVGKDLLRGLGEGIATEGPELLDMGADLVMDLLDQIIAHAPELAEGGVALIEKLVQSLIDQGPELLISAAGMVAEIVTGLAQAAPELIPAAVQLVTQLITALIESAPDLLLAGLELVYGIISGIIEGLGDIANSAGDIIDAVVSAFSERSGEILSIGNNIVSGIWQGISGSTEWIYGKISGWVTDVVQWIKTKLGIESPSKVMEAEVGYWMARGVGSGWEKEMRNVNKAISNSINTSFDIPDIDVDRSSYTGRTYTTPSGKIVNLYITAKYLTQADISMLLDLVDRKLGEDL